MGNSSSSQHKVSAHDRAVLDLKVQRDKLSQYQKRLTILISESHASARAALAEKDQRNAKLALRRKKYQESILQKTDAQLTQLENLTHEVEFAMVQKEVFNGIKKGTQVLAQIRKDMGGIEEVERVMNQNEEERERMAEIDSMLAGRMTSEEEDEVEEELARMEAQEQVKNGRLPNAPKEQPIVPERLPDAPQTIKTPQVHARAEERQTIVE